MVRVERSENTFPIQVKVFANEEDPRHTVKAVVYPGYDEYIRMKIDTVGLGFMIDLKNAKHLRDVLDHAIRTLE